MKTLITGARSGLGKYLSEQIESDTLNREDNYDDFYRTEYDLIIQNIILVQFVFRETTLLIF